MGKILLVEDDNNLREIYGARLMAEGHEIVSANDGEEALAIAVKEKPDLIIADVMMPRISGFDMLDILRNAPETKNTKIIMMTALSQQEDKEHAEKLGADKYLVKSQVTLEDVAQVVREILGESKGGQGKPDDTQPSKDTPEDTKPKDDPPAGNSPPSTPPPSPDKPASSPPADRPSDTPQPAQEQKSAKTPDSTPSAPTTPEPAATPPAPSQPSAQPDKPESTPPAPPAQQSSPDPQTSQAGNSTLPSAPASNDAAAPSSPPDNNSPIKSSSISIPVVEPPADKPEENAKPAEQKPESTQQATPQGPPTSSPPAAPPADDTSTNDAADTSDKKDEDDKIGPNLAQALAEEEKQVKEQIDNFENKIDENNGSDKKPEAGDSNQQPTVISPTKPQDDSQATPEKAKDTSTDKKDDSEQKTESSADSPGKDSLNPKKKVIQPINDLSKKPDLAAMAAEEEKTAKVINQNVVAPENKPDDNNAKPDNKTNPHDISI